MALNQRTQGAIKDITEEFKKQKQRIEQRKAKDNFNWWSDESMLREKMERFKPLNNKFGKNKKKEKTDEEIQESEPEYKGLRNSTLSDESGSQRTNNTETTSIDFDGVKNSK